jgi:hypothetical protein
MTSRLWYIQVDINIKFSYIKEKIVVAHLDWMKNYKSKNLQGNE